MSDTSDLVILRDNVLSLQVCAPSNWTREQIETATNAQYSTGISSKWSIAEDIEPVTCANDANRTHWILIC